MSNYGFGWSPQGGAQNPYQNTGYNGPVRNNYNNNFRPRPNQFSQNAPQNWQPAKKRNGAKKFQGKNGNSYISGWFVDKFAGLVKVLVYAKKNSDTVHTSKSGREWQSMGSKVTYMNTGQTGNYNALLELSTGRVTIKDLNIGLSPSRNWCGFYFKGKK